MIQRNETFEANGVRAARKGEAGSAYLVVLMLLVVLTIIGLSLSVITQTEVIIGGSEKQSTRQLYSAGSAVHMAAVYELVANDSARHKMVLSERQETLFGASVTVGDTLCTTPFLQVQVGTCNLCMMNQDAGFKAVQYGVTAAALRFANTDLGARRTVGAMLALEPWEANIAGFQNASGEVLRDDGDLSSSSTDETDPCENLTFKL